MDNIKKQVELIAREFGNVRNVVHVDTVHDEMRLIFRIEFDSIDAAQRAIQAMLPSALFSRFAALLLCWPTGHRHRPRTREVHLRERHVLGVADPHVRQRT